MKKVFLIVCIVGVLSGLYFIDFHTRERLVIILSPHFDDAVLSLGGFMAQQKDPVIVATFFTGNPEKVVNTEWDRSSGFVDSAEATRIRTGENERALDLFGANIKNYSYLDAQYRMSEQYDGNKLKALRESIARDILQLIQGQGDKDISIYAPGGFEASRIHADHKMLYDAFVDAVRGSDLPHVNYFVYEDLYDARQAVSDEMPLFKDYAEKKDGLRFTKITTRISESDFIKKIQAVNVYASQVKAFAAQGYDVESMVRDFNKGRCKADQPSVYACEVVYKASVY